MTPPDENPTFNTPNSTPNLHPQRLPRVLVPCDNRILGGHPFHVLGRKYTDAVRHVAGCLPILLPTHEAQDLEAYLALSDGILLTGSPANVHPSHFGQDVADPSLPLDPQRDAVTLPLVRRAVEQGMPLLAICRGLQEINVALGGSLHQAVHHLPGRMDHRVRVELPPLEQYEPAHEIELLPGSLLACIAGAQKAVVNSAHGQAIDRVAPGLVVEATAPDGTIEAVRILDHPGFGLALQWHPEWRAADNPLSRRIFHAFGQACLEWRARADRQAAGAATKASASTTSSMD